MKLIVIDQSDLVSYGCPYCGCIEGGAYLSFGTFCLWGCEACAEECAVVQSKHLLDSFLKKANNLIGRHPFRYEYKFEDTQVYSPFFLSSVSYSYLKSRVS